MKNFESKNTKGFVFSYEEDEDDIILVYCD